MSDPTAAVVDREQRLSQINAELEKRNLRSLHKLGDASKGEIELLGIQAIYDHSARFFTDVKFDCLFPNGKTGEFTLRFNASSRVSEGAVIVAVVNGRFAVVKQWRPALGLWTHEVPRGFGEKIDSACIAGTFGTLKIGDLPLGTLARELGEEVMASAEITSVTHLGNVAQDSGTHTSIPSYFLILVRADESKLDERLRGSDDEVAKVLLWDAKQVRAEIGKRLRDNHSITALCLALNYIDSLPRP